MKVALDDFGAGASSFGYLKSLPVDFLKIDGHFITHLLDDEIDNAAVRCFCQVAKVMGIKTIAEFVEREAVRDELLAIGIDMAQGYLIHKPEPLDGLLSNGPPCTTPAHPQAKTDGAHKSMARDRARSRPVTEIVVDAGPPNRLDVDNFAEVMLCADDLSISAEELRRIVTKVGPMRAAIRYYVQSTQRSVPAPFECP